MLRFLLSSSPSSFFQTHEEKIPYLFRVIRLALEEAQSSTVASKSELQVIRAH